MRVYALFPLHARRPFYPLSLPPPSPSLSMGAVLLVAAVGAASGAVAELYCPVPTIDDNLFEPVATAAAVTAFVALLGEPLLGLPSGGGLPTYDAAAAAPAGEGAGARAVALLRALLPLPVPDALPPPAPGVFQVPPLLSDTAEISVVL